jgi:uncharacterized protein
MGRRILTSALGALLLVSAPAAAQQEKTIDVVGDSALSARNDTARIAVSTEGRRPTSRAALGLAAARMRGVLARVRARGIESRDIRTRFVNVGRVRVGPRGARRIAYVARNSVSITIRDVGTVGRVLDAAAAGGASGIGGPSFFIADTRALYRAALVAAFDVARTKAEELAARSGVTLGPAVSIREEGFESSGDGSGFDEQAGGVAPGRPRTPVSPGRTRVGARVFVRFAIE